MRNIILQTSLDIFDSNLTKSKNSQNWENKIIEFIKELGLYNKTEKIWDNIPYHYRKYYLIIWKDEKYNGFIKIILVTATLLILILCLVKKIEKEEEEEILRKKPRIKNLDEEISNLLNILCENKKNIEYIKYFIEIYYFFKYNNDIIKSYGFTINEENLNKFNEQMEALFEEDSISKEIEKWKYIEEEVKNSDFYYKFLEIIELLNDLSIKILPCDDKIQEFKNKNIHKH